jgi:hypothetical protein
MPNKPHRPCPFSGRRELIEASRRYCAEHQAIKHAEADAYRKEDPRLAAAMTFRNSVRWQMFRKWFRVKHPLCFDPFGDHKEEARPEPAASHRDTSSTSGFGLR